MMNFDTLLEAMEALQKDGYTYDFNLGCGALESTDLRTDVGVDEFHVDAFFRFEGISNPDDSTILFAISTTRGVKGLLVDAYGAYADALTQEMIDKLKMV